MVDQWSQIFDTLVRGQGPSENHGELRRFLRSLPAHLRQLSTSRSALETLQASAYEHGNGFEKIVLWRSPERGLVKLDVWDPAHPLARASGPDVSWGDVHDHRWDFASVVLSGALHIAHFERGGSQRFYGSIFEDNRMREADGAFLRQLFAASLTPACTYGIRSEQLHATGGDPSGPTTTFVVQSPAAKRFSNVFSPIPPADSPVRPLSLDRVEHLVASAADHASRLCP